jgi:uncharacterized protein YdeI (YjbR/CyaY-like superfamily)
MAEVDPRVDAYIAKSPDLARPILVYLRTQVHAACPRVEETIKWGMPCFLHHGMLCTMAAFKQHCSLGFWKHRLIFGAGTPDDAMGQFGRITALSDLPPKRVLAGHFRKAMQLNEMGVSAARPRARPRPAPRTPADLAAALARNASAAATYKAFSPSAKREYVEWITDAKTASTRQRRLETAIEWIAQGRQRNWKYMDC